MDILSSPDTHKCPNHEAEQTLSGGSNSRTVHARLSAWSKRMGGKDKKEVEI